MANNGKAIHIGIEEGRRVEDLAIEFGISVSTARRHAKQWYQVESTVEERCEIAEQRRVRHAIRHPNSIPGKHRAIADAWFASMAKAGCQGDDCWGCPDCGIGKDLDF